MISRKRHGHIGLDLGRSAIKAVQISRTGQRTRVEAAAVIPYPSNSPAIDTECAQRIRGICHRQGFRGNRFVLAMPEEKLHIELLDLPPRHSGAPVDQLARAELMRLAKLESEPFEMATWDLPAPPRGGAGTAVIAVAARHTDTQPIYQVFEDEGLCIEAIDVQSCAIARACHGRADTTGTAAVLDIGFNRAVMMFLRDGVVVFQRGFTNCGTNAVHAELIKRLEVDPDVAAFLMSNSITDQEIATSPQAQTVQTLLGRYADTLSSELESSFAYIMHRYSDAHPSEILAVGGGSMSSAARDLLKARLGIPVEPLSPIALIECAPSTTEKCSTPQLTTALGLALYEGD